MSDWKDYKCGVCNKTGLSWQACEYPGCPDGREPARFPAARPVMPVRQDEPPRIDFYATYKHRPPSPWLTVLDYLMLAGFILSVCFAGAFGWWVASHMR